MKNKQGFLVVGVMVLLAVLVAGGAFYAYQNTQKATTNDDALEKVDSKTEVAVTTKTTVTPNPGSVVPGDWATYQAAGLQFNYPREWKLKLLNEGVRTTVYTTDIENPDPAATFGGVFSMSYAPNQGGLTLEGWWVEANKGGRYTKTGETTIAGYPAYIAFVNNSDDGEHILFITHPKNAMSYVVDIKIVAKHSKEILASFKAI